MIKGKSIIIFGASGGIGSVLTHVFVEAKANVTLVARNKDKLADLAKDLDETRVLVAPTDATDPEAVEQVFRKTEEEFGSVDAVVIASGSWGKPVSLTTLHAEAVEMARKHFEEHFLILSVVGRVALRHFVMQKGGLLVNLSSHAGSDHTLSGNDTYGPMKAAADALMLRFRSEMKNNGNGVRVTSLVPMIVNTPDTAKALGEDKDKAVQPEEMAQWIIDHFDDSDVPPTVPFHSAVVLKRK